MEEETPTNGNEPKPRNKSNHTPSHLPGADTAKKKYPKSGSEEEFWNRCEQATTLRGRQMSYPEIGRRLGVSDVMAYNMVSRYLRGAARFYPAIQLRELLAHRYRDLYAQVMQDIESLQGDKDLIDKRLACIARAESLIAKEALLFGFVSNSADINIITNSNGDEIVRPLPSNEDQRRLRQLARQLREIREGVEVEEAKFAITDESKDKGNGDQGKNETSE